MLSIEVYLKRELAPKRCLRDTIVCRLCTLWAFPVEYEGGRHATNQGNVGAAGVHWRNQARSIQVQVQGFEILGGQSLISALCCKDCNWSLGAQFLCNREVLEQQAQG
jgi:hypothetical protein